MVHPKDKKMDRGKIQSWHIHTYRHTDRQTNRKTDILTYRDADIHTYILTYMFKYFHTEIITYITQVHTLHAYKHTYTRCKKTYMHTCIH